MDTNFKWIDAYFDEILLLQNNGDLMKLLKLNLMQSPKRKELTSSFYFFITGVKWS